MKSPSHRSPQSSLSRDISQSHRLKRKPMFDQTGNTLLNGVKLTFQRGFGFNQNLDINSNVHSIDDNKIVYLLGKQIIQYDMLTENQKVVDQIDQQEDITSFIYFKNLMLDDNILYAVHAANKTFPSVIAKNYSKNITQKYVLAHLEKDEKVISLCLISENKYIVALSELEGTYRLSYVDVQTKEILASQSVYFKVLGMLIPEANKKCIILYTPNQLYYLQFGQQIKPVPLYLNKNLAQNISNSEQNSKEKFLSSSRQIIEVISSIFTNNDVQLYALTNLGQLLFINVNSGLNKLNSVQNLFLGTFQTIDPESGQIVTKNRIPSCICCNQYHILIGYYFIEQFSLIKISPIMNSLPSIQPIKFSCPMLHKIQHMQFAHQTMSICITVQVKQNDKYDLTIPIKSQYLKEKGQQSQIKQSLSNHLLKPGKIFPIIFNMLLYDTLVQTLRSPIQSILGWMMFVKDIMDIAVLPTKKIMLILSKERKIKAVKYEHLSSTSFEKMLMWEMHFNPVDGPSSLDIHPLTFNVAVGFRQGLKLFTISSQGLKPNNIQFPLKNCQSIRYSKFGHHLIAGSSNQIIVINPYQNKIINTISLNSGYNVKQLFYIDRDAYIFSHYSNGSTIVMSNEGHKIFEVWKKDSKALCATYDSIFDIMAVSYEENFTKFYREKGNQQFGVLWTYPFNVTKLLIVNELGTIFMGTSMGKIRAYQWPFTDMIRFNKSFTQIQLHSSPITKLKIIHDYSLLISGGQDGSIFISKINVFSDGIAITDSQIIHSLKSTNKNFTNLFYLQNYMITSNMIQYGQQQIIVQLQSDKADFQTEYSQVIMNIQQANQERLLQEERIKQTDFKKELQGREKQIQELNQRKIQLREEILEVERKKQEQIQQMEETKLDTMRKLYKQSDQLKAQKAQYEHQFAQQLKNAKQTYSNQYNTYLKQLQTKQSHLMNQIKSIQSDYNKSLIHNKQLLNEQNEQNIIFKNRMLKQLQQQLQLQKQCGQKLRKMFNKIKHDNSSVEQKIKNFQQIVTQIDIDLIQNKQRQNQLKLQQKYLSTQLVEKDKTILEEEKNVKLLLSKNITNYSHEEYLKHLQEQLIDKVKYLEQELVKLDQKYHDFQKDFVQVTHQANDLDDQVKNSRGSIEELKQKDSKLRQELYLKKYKNKELYDKIVEAFHGAKCDKKQFIKQAQQIFASIQPNNINKASLATEPTTKGKNTLLKQSKSSLLPPSLSYTLNPPQQTPMQKTFKRDHLIKQVVNTNNLRKIDDNIRRTIMIKLNRQTVSLTCQVNELRKEKKKLAIKLKELKCYIDDLGGLSNIEEKDHLAGKGGKKTLKKNDDDGQEKENYIGEDQDIVPGNISIIRAKPSKHCNSMLGSSSARQERMLPFQAYHNKNKLSSKHSYYNSRNTTKGDFDQSSTQLPSILKNSHSHSMSQEGSNLFNVDEISDLPQL